MKNSIRPKFFFRTALFLPALAPLVAFPFGFSAGTAILVLSLQFGGVQYLIFASCAFVALGRLRTSRSRLVLFWLSPTLFLPVELIGWAIRQYIERTMNEDLVLTWDFIYPMTAFTLAVGYGYVVLVASVYALLIWRGLIARDSD